jgi:hypothetical protein
MKAMCETCASERKKRKRGTLKRYRGSGEQASGNAGEDAGVRAVGRSGEREKERNATARTPQR